MPRPSKIHPHRGKFRFRLAGQEYEYETEREAKAQFHILMGRHLAETGNTDRPHTVAGAVEKWLALNPSSAYATWLPTFVEFAGREYLMDVERDILTRYHVHLKAQRVKRNTYDRATKEWSVKATDKPLAAGTVRHYLKAAAAVLEWARGQGWLECEPVAPKVPKGVRKARDVEPGKLADALDDLPDRAGHILRFIAATGCRPSEACKLEWSQVHLEAGICILPGHKTAKKTGKPRTIYLTDEASVILRAMLPKGEVPTGPVFRSRLGEPYTSSGLRSILRRHGGINPYSLRHTFAQTALDTLPMEDVATLLGHADLATVQTYCQIRDRRAVAAAKSIRIGKAE
ncbi:MAG TPA: site-specific integrase [Phycisphaerae bacterium]|nr:site-specific integrase [Phycisphaerae bacterium]